MTNETGVWSPANDPPQDDEDREFLAAARDLEQLPLEVLWCRLARNIADNMRTLREIAAQSTKEVSLDY
jgi:hypothetical protein